MRLSKKLMTNTSAKYRQQLLVTFCVLCPSLSLSWLTIDGNVPLRSAEMKKLKGSNRYSEPNSVYQWLFPL